MLYYREGTCIKEELWGRQRETLRVTVDVRWGKEMEKQLIELGEEPISKQAVKDLIETEEVERMGEPAAEVVNKEKEEKEEKEKKKPTTKELAAAAADSNAKPINTFHAPKPVPVPVPVPALAPGLHISTFPPPAGSPVVGISSLQHCLAIKDLVKIVRE